MLLEEPRLKENRLTKDGVEPMYRVFEGFIDKDLDRILIPIGHISPANTALKPENIEVKFNREIFDGKYTGRVFIMYNVEYKPDTICQEIRYALLGSSHLTEKQTEKLTKYISKKMNKYTKKNQNARTNK